nr:hypothetical protein B824_25785 [Mannheimia haemolytica USDA-ARS-USMARC-184]
MIYTSFVIVITFIEISIFLRKELSYRKAAFIFFLSYILIFGIDNIFHFKQNKSILLVIAEPIIISVIFSLLALWLFKYHKEKN